MTRIKTLTGSALLAALLLMLFALGIASADEPDMSRTVPVKADRGPVQYVPSPDAILLDEGFEENMIPPTGWEHIQNNPNETWGISDFNPYAGTYNAHTLYDPALVQQDEWLVSSPIFLDAGATNTLSMWSLGSLFWCRDDNDNCDLEVWLIQGPNIGDADDTMVAVADDDWSATYTWSQTVIDLSPDLPASGAVRIGLRYVGVDGAEIGVDDIVLDGTESAPTDVSLTGLGGESPGAGLWMFAVLLVTVAFSGALVARRSRQS